VATRRIAPAVLAAAPALLASAAAAQLPSAAEAGWGVSASVAHRRLVERADNGRQLLEETGPMLRIGFGGELPLANGGALRAKASVAAGGLDYRGVTQGGSPIETRTGHRDLEARLGWRPWPAASWGEAWVAVRVLEQRRQIASTATAAGLHETSTLWMPGLRWSHRFEGGGWDWEPSAAWHTSVRHHLEVRYGGLFDPSDLKGGRRTELVLGLTASRAGSAWQWSVEWSRARQAASAWQPLYRRGLRAGTVRQPRLEIDDVSLRLTREF
jgi:hypothetical protein